MKIERHLILKVEGKYWELNNEFAFPQKESLIVSLKPDTERHLPQINLE